MTEHATPSGDPGGKPPHRLTGLLGRSSGWLHAFLSRDVTEDAPETDRQSSDKEGVSERKRNILSSLFVKILTVNLTGLLIFVVLLLGFSQYRKTLVDERLQGLTTASRFVSGALEQSALIDRDERPDDAPYSAIDRDAAISILRTLVEPAGLRGRIYDYDGSEIYDSWYLARDGQLSTQALRGNPNAGQQRSLIDNFMLWIMGPRLTPGTDDPNMPFTEVQAVLDGNDDPAALKSLRQDEQGNLIVSVAIPVRQLQRHVGVLLISTKSGDFDAVLRAEFQSLGQIFLLALAANIFLAILFTRSVVRPIRRLVTAADRIRFARPGPGGAGRQEIPGFGDRRDEIGDLARSLNEMTRTLNKRLDAIEQFAADVSHEIKTPLTSLRSACETFDIATSDKARTRLIEVIQHDVNRLDRLITDISNASRLDAELSREEAEQVNMPRLLREIVQIYKDSGSLKEVALHLDVRSGARDESALNVQGIQSRLGQVVQNLIENAISFSPPQGEVRVSVGLERHHGAPFIALRVDDGGPGIPEEALEKIFQRFYTQRETDDFGKNSGLGLSISEQIVDVHHGRIWAENRATPSGKRLGARFTVLLPADLGASA